MEMKVRPVVSLVPCGRSSEEDHWPGGASSVPPWLLLRLCSSALRRGRMLSALSVLVFDY